MRNAILRELMTEYEQLRAANTREELRRREEVSRRCPEIAVILEQRQQLIFQGVRNVLDGQGERGKPSAANGGAYGAPGAPVAGEWLPATYLDPVYRCVRCKDTGYVGETVRDMCDCMKSRYYARLYRQVGLSEKGAQSFETYNENLFSTDLLPNQRISQRECMALLRDICQEYADTYPIRPRGSAAYGAQRPGENLPDARHGQTPAGPGPQCADAQRLPLSGPGPQGILFP